MRTGSVIPPSPSDCYITVEHEVSPAPQPPTNLRVVARAILRWYASILTILSVLLLLFLAKFPQADPDITVVSLSSSSSAAVAWDVGFSIADTRAYGNLTMKATLFNGNVPVSDSAALGPVVLDASTRVAKFSIPDTTRLRARYLTPCTAVSNLTAKLEIEDRAPLVKFTRRLMVACENVVVLLPSNRSCYSCSPPALLDRASCRNDSTELQRNVYQTLISMMFFVFLSGLGCCVMLVVS